MVGMLARAMTTAGARVVRFNSRGAQPGTSATWTGLVEAKDYQTVLEASCRAFSKRWPKSTGIHLVLAVCCCHLLRFRQQVVTDPLGLLHRGIRPAQFSEHSARPWSGFEPRACMASPVTDSFLRQRFNGTYPDVAVRIVAAVTGHLPARLLPSRCALGPPPDAGVRHVCSAGRAGAAGTGHSGALCLRRRRPVHGNRGTFRRLS